MLRCLNSNPCATCCPGTVDPEVSVNTLEAHNETLDQAMVTQNSSGVRLSGEARPRVLKNGKCIEAAANLLALEEGRPLHNVVRNATSRQVLLA